MASLDGSSACWLVTPLQRLLPRWSKHSQRLPRLVVPPHPDLAADLAMVSDDAMADETTPVSVAKRTRVRVETATTVVAIATTVIEATAAVKAEVKAPFEQKVAVMVVVTVAALASARHVAAAVAAKAGRTRVAGPRKAPVETRTGDLPIRVRVQIKLHALMHPAGSIRMPDAPIRAADSSKLVAATRPDAPIRVAGSSKVVVSKAVAPIKVAGSSKVVASKAVAAIVVPAASSSHARIKAATSIRAHGVINLPGLMKASFGTTLATALQMERPDRKPMETVPVAIARIAVAAANAVADEDADAADAAVAAEAKAVIAKVARMADRPWTPALKAVGRRTPSLPRPRQCHRVTVAIITMKVVLARARTNSRALRRTVASTANLAMKPRSSASLGSRSRPASRNSRARANRCASRSRSVSHSSLARLSRCVNRSQHASHSRTPGRRKLTIGLPSLNSGHRLLHRNM